MNWKYEIGEEIPREGKSPLIICGYSVDGKYLARTKRAALKEGKIGQVFDILKFKPGTILRFEGERDIVLIGDRGTGYWDSVNNDVMALSEVEIEEIAAGAHASKIYSSVATKRETGFNSKNLRYLPRRMDNEPSE